jgi:NADH-quinone oxidoreductase subunit C
MLPDEISAAIIKTFPDARSGPGGNAVIIPKNSLLEVARYLSGGALRFDNLHCVTAIDRKASFEVIYILYSIREHHTIILKIDLAPEDLNVASLSSIWRSAIWLERETYDLFGIFFLGHPDLRRILNPYDWKGYPLRKDYIHPEFITRPRI